MTLGEQIIAVRKVAKLMKEIADELTKEMLTSDELQQDYEKLYFLFRLQENQELESCYYSLCVASTIKNAMHEQGIERCFNDKAYKKLPFGIIEMAFLQHGFVRIPRVDDGPIPEGTLLFELDVKV